MLIVSVLEWQSSEDEKADVCGHRVDYNLLSDTVPANIPQHSTDNPTPPTLWKEVHKPTSDIKHARRSSFPQFGLLR